MKVSPVTIIDIAKKLGISKSTVSRALKNHPDISQATKDAVNKLAESLNYVPNTVASGFRNKKTKIIGLIVPQISYFFFPSVVQGIEAVVHKKGYKLMILQSDESYEREVENLNVLIANNVEGILSSVSLETRNFEHFQHVIDIGLPIVFFDRIVKGLDTDVVLVDDVTGACKAVKRLIEADRKRIAICTGNMNLLISNNRLQGYKTALIQAEISIDEDLILSCDTPEETEYAVTALLNKPTPPDAIFAISDLTMTGVMKAVFNKKLKVPEDISVIGFCEEPFRSMYHPQLTTIEPMGFEIGHKATELLFERLEDTNNWSLAPRVIYLDSHLKEGGSV
ncbi:MAG: LacI family DNA-binding transcriptional regulator [Paludibacter sp.]|nr:LacI family DNA-binding transcriptional regulator [Paludibacter sp.]